jgi:hypothetical protein
VSIKPPFDTGENIIVAIVLAPGAKLLYEQLPTQPKGALVVIEPLIGSEPLLVMRRPEF